MDDLLKAMTANAEKVEAALDGFMALKATPEGKRRYRKDGKLRKGQREHDETDAEYAARLEEYYDKHPEEKAKVGQLVAGQRAHDETVEEYLQRLLTDIAERPDSYFQRATVVRLEEELDAARRDVWSVVQGIDATAFEQPPRNPDACFRFGSPCEYFDVCSGAASIDDPARFRTVAAHPELTVEVVA